MDAPHLTAFNKKKRLATLWLMAGLFLLAFALTRPLADEGTSLHEALEVTPPGDERSIPARVVSAEALGDEIIYVVDHGGSNDVRVRMPPTVRFAEDATVGLRHSGATPPVYDPSTEGLVA